MKIDPFAVEIWMNEHETKCAFNLAETCVDSLTVAELLEIAGKSTDDLGDLLDMRLSYGAIEGSSRATASSPSFRPISSTSPSLKVWTPPSNDSNCDGRTITGSISRSCAGR